MAWKRYSLLLLVPILAIPLLFLRHYKQRGRFVPPPDEDEQTYGLVFDTATGLKCSTITPSKEALDLRQTFLARRAGKTVANVHYDAFIKRAEEDKFTAYYVIYGKCPR